MAKPLNYAQQQQKLAKAYNALTEVILSVKNPHLGAELQDIRQKVYALRDTDQSNNFIYEDDRDGAEDLIQDLAEALDNALLHRGMVMPKADFTNRSALVSRARERKQ